MTEEILYLDLDFMPPTAERLFKLPRFIKEAGIRRICLKMLCNFPWEFEPRMRADSFYPENVTSYFFKLCSDAGLRLTFVFPGPYDFGRLLRVPGYSRLACGDCRISALNPESTGMRSFLESITEDVISLVPDIEGFVLRQHEGGEYRRERFELYSSIAADFTEICGYTMGRLSSEHNFKYTEEFFAAFGESRFPLLVDELEKAASEIESFVRTIRQYGVMSSLSCSSPAAGRQDPAELYRGLMEYRRKFEDCIKLIRDEGTSLIDECWKDRFLSAVKITADEDFETAVTRLRRIGIFKDT